MLATVKYDFSCSSWVATLDDNPYASASGTTPDEAIENLRRQANKHDLWPK